MDLGVLPPGCPFEKCTAHDCSCVQIVYGELLKIVEMVEPTLLSCRDVLEESGDSEGLKQVERKLTRVKFLKTKLMA